MYLNQSWYQIGGDSDWSKFDIGSNPVEQPTDPFSIFAIVMRARIAVRMAHGDILMYFVTLTWGNLSGISCTVSPRPEAPRLILEQGLFLSGNVHWISHSHISATLVYKSLPVNE